MWLNANEEMLAGYADPDASYPDADSDATYLNKGYADTDLCISELYPCTVPVNKKKKNCNSL